MPDPARHAARALRVALLGVLCALVLLAGPAAEAEAPAPTVTQLSVRSFDGTRLDATLFGAAGEAPLVVAGHGAAKSRLKDLSKARTTPEHIVQELVALGFHVLTYDRRGFGSSEGLGQLGDLEIDGQDLAAVLDWIAAPGHVPGLLRDAEGEPVLGYSGYSMSADPVALMTTDAFDAVYLGIGLTDVLEAFTPGGKPYQGWLNALLLMSGRQEFSYRPELRKLVRQGLRHRLRSGMKGAEDFAASRNFDCARAPAGDAPVLLMPGLSDGLYPLNQAARLRDCLQQVQGRETLLIGQEKGHIIPGSFPNRGRLFNALWPVHNGFTIDDLQPRIAETVRCPDLLETAPLVAHWFARYLDPALITDEQRAEIEGLPRVCLPLGGDEGVAMAELPRPRERFPFQGAELTVSNYDALPDALARRDGRAGLDAPVFVPLYAATEAQVLAGIPRLDLYIEELSAREKRLEKLALFIGVGVRRADGALELLNGQRQPFLIAQGPFLDAELRGVATRLQPGEELGLMIYGHDFFFDAGALITKGGPDRAHVRVSGVASLPLVPGEGPLLVETEAEGPATEVETP